ncbi:MAG: serine/threonine protein kinase [Sandaracinaceae bacterium]|nr:serine/threonine protein kinase [Sandaracinaceae bacterium]
MKQPIPFGNYLLLERVNIGGMAEVFKAKAFGVEGFERLVAVKRILPSIAEDQEFITMFIDEAKIAVQLSHANICQIFDLGKVGDSFFIAMEFCAGKDVRAIFDRGRKLKETVPIPMACYTIMKVCEGLDYAHNKKDAASRDLHLVHRDVSPQNLLVTWDGEIKIVDFGIAKAANKAGKTQAGILKGKFGYMSPEQVRGLPIDRRSDVFAVGICLYELLTGERLFYGDSDFNTLEMVRNVEIVPATTYNKSIPQELERILLKALAKDVDDRYQTAMDLHDDLQSFMYTSGNFFARKDLSAYMRQTFAEEVAKEAARDEQYRKIKAPAASPPAKGAPKAPPTLPATSGAKATSQGQGPATMSNVPPPPPGGGSPKKPVNQPSQTIQGVGGAPSLRGGSLPPPIPGVRASAPTPPPPATPAPAMDMDWDDDGEATQIYDKFDEIEGLSATPLGGAPASTTLSGGLSAPIVSAGPMGNPSPFDDLPAGSPAATPATSKVADPAPAKAAEKAATPASGEKKSMGPMVIGLVAVLLGLAAAAWFLLAKDPGTIRLATDPPDSEVYMDSVRVAGSSSPFIITNVTPGVPHIIEVRAEGFRSWSAPITVQSGQELSMDAVALRPEGAAGTTRVAAGTGGFTLNTTPPGATVYVDGTRVPGTTPVTAADLSAGAHQVRVEMEGHGTWQDEIVIAAGQTVAVPSVTLSPADVLVRFASTPPGASVLLVGPSRERRLGVTPTEVDVDMQHGPYTVRMTLDGYAEWSEPLQVTGTAREFDVNATLQRAGRVGPGTTTAGTPPTGTMTADATDMAGTTTVAAMDEPVETPMTAGGTGPGTLRINTRPWSQVYVDGRLIGNTPQMNISLPAGSHRVTLVNPDFNIRQSVSVTIEAGQVTTRVLTLDRPE